MAEKLEIGNREWAPRDFPIRNGSCRRVKIKGSPHVVGHICFEGDFGPNGPTKGIYTVMTGGGSKVAYRRSFPAALKALVRWHRGRSLP